MTHPPIFMLRHGQTRWNAQRRFQGQLNSDLTDMGKSHAAAQGRLLGLVFEQFPDIDIYASPLGRVRETAAIALANHNRTAIFADALKEISVGDWEGLTALDIEAGWPDIFNASQTSTDLFLAAPKGEGYEALHKRCCGFLSSLNRPSIVFSHGFTIRLLRKIVRGLSYEDLTGLDNRQGCIYLIKDGQETLLAEAK